MTGPDLPHCLFLAFSFVCISTTESNAQRRNRIDDYPTVKRALNKRVWSPSKSYYVLTRASDSTVHLAWGNDTLKRKLDNDLPLWPAAERLHIRWSNRHYLILEYWTGSGVWVDLVLPINKREKVAEFGNALYFDSEYDLLCIEQSGDTILTVENLKTKQRQFVVDKEHRCDAGLNSSCIEKVSIKNKFLYLRWVVPYDFADPKTVFEKRIKLQL